MERGWTYHTASAGTPSDSRIIFAGGRNIAREEEIEYPTVSPEWVVQSDPDVIVRLVWATTGVPFTKEELGEVRSEIMARSELDNVKAVKNGKVYVMSSKANSGVMSMIGELYLADWFHPELFEDVDPGEVHQDMIQKFYGLEVEGAYVYP